MKFCGGIIFMFFTIRRKPNVLGILVVSVLFYYIGSIIRLLDTLLLYVYGTILSEEPAVKARWAGYFEELYRVDPPRRALSVHTSKPWLQTHPLAAIRLLSRKLERRWSS